MENECNKEQLSLKREAEDATRGINAQVIFSGDDIVIAEEIFFSNLREYKAKYHHNMMKKDYEGLKLNTDPRKTASVFSLPRRAQSSPGR